ncbi:MAG: S8 family serine peptidase [Actinomycetia bacterium]|nr:S8 family serine peptidase [Actinomycetes bacterium]MCP4960519.1 S8 family serine peptidase [Actinomycetes bacterium]
MKRLAALLAVTTLAIALTPTGASAQTEVLAVVKVDSSSSAVIRDLASDHGAKVVEIVVKSRGIAVFADLDSKERKDLEKDPRTIWVEDLDETRPGDDRFHAWPANVNPEPNANLGQGLEALELDAAHAQADGRGAVVAVLDTGVDRRDPGLARVVVDGWDFVDDDRRPRDRGNAKDDDGDGLVDEATGHGTHVAGIVHQVAPGATILAYRVLDSDGHGSVYAVVEAIDDAIAAGADVINISFGSSDKIQSKQLKEALKRARKAGVVVVAAAGNTGADTKQYPAAENEVLGVTAWDPDAGALPGFAAHGKWVDVAAPGVDVVSHLPGGRTAAWSGTSMATPVVAGQAALLLGYDPTLEPKEVEKAIRDSTRKIDRKVRPDKGVVDLLASLARVS